LVCLFVCLFVDWLVGELFVCLFGCLFAWLVGWLFVCLVVWLVGSLVGSLVWLCTRSLAVCCWFGSVTVVVIHAGKSRCCGVSMVWWRVLDELDVVVLSTLLVGFAWWGVMAVCFYL